VTIFAFTVTPTDVDVGEGEGDAPVPADAVGDAPGAVVALPLPTGLGVDDPSTGVPPPEPTVAPPSQPTKIVDANTSHVTVRNAFIFVLSLWLRPRGKSERWKWSGRRRRYGVDGKRSFVDATTHTRSLNATDRSQVQVFARSLLMQLPVLPVGYANAYRRVPSGSSTSCGRLPSVRTARVLALTTTPTDVDVAAGDGDSLPLPPGELELVPPPPGDVEPDPPEPGTLEPIVAPPSHATKIVDAHTSNMTVRNAFISLDFL
jgi:hypothetical protein